MFFIQKLIVSGIRKFEQVILFLFLFFRLTAFEWMVSYREEILYIVLLQGILSLYSNYCKPCYTFVLLIYLKLKNYVGWDTKLGGDWWSLSLTRISVTENAGVSILGMAINILLYNFIILFYFIFILLY